MFYLKSWWYHYKCHNLSALPIEFGADETSVFALDIRSIRDGKRGLEHEKRRREIRRGFLLPEIRGLLLGHLRPAVV